jgi:hypothetical protein
MKMKMKSAFILSIFSGWSKKDENVFVFAFHDVVHGPQILVTNIHVTNVKKMANEIARFNS